MARRKSLTRKDRKIDMLTHLDYTNSEAKKEGPAKKRYTQHDLRNIKPMNEAQRMFFESYILGANVVANGSAGTGKSFCGLYLALNDVLDEEKPQERVIIVRSAVPTREVGHLPGDIKEKLSVYEEPYRDIVGNLLKRNKAYDDMKDLGKIEFMPTSFIRGLTWDNAVVVIDEGQSMSFHELNSVITRIGDNTRVIVCGDIAQNDLITRRNDLSGFTRMVAIAEKMESFDIVTFTRKDIVRSKFVYDWICASEDTPE